MTINVAELLTEVNASRKIELCSEVAGFEYMSEQIGFKGNVSLSGEIKRAQSKYYKFTGTVKAVLILQCGLCLTDYEYPVEYPLDIEFTTREKAIDDEADSYYTDGDTVDFEEAIQTNAIMNIPAKRLCKPDCKGLCAVCGANLNKECCNCTQEDDGCDASIDARLAVLKDFFK